MMGLKVHRRGQNLVEYALVIAIVSAAAVAMSTYVFRAVQSKQKAIGEEFQKE
jgi:Flp pilus assembly pilin Flp